MKRLILPDDASAKASIIEIGRRMYDKNYCAANDGNISCKTEEGCYWVTPSGVSKGFLTEDMLIQTEMFWKPEAIIRLLPKFNCI